MTGLRPRTRNADSGRRLDNLTKLVFNGVEQVFLPALGSIMLLDLLAHLDWFERTDELFKSIIGIRSWRFCVPRCCGWSGYNIEQFLRQYGVKIWGRNFSADYLFFRVKLQQANWTEYLLWQCGVPVCGRPFNPRNQLYATHRSPVLEPLTTDQDTAQRGWLDDIFSLFS